MCRLLLFWMFLEDFLSGVGPAYYWDQITEHRYAKTQSQTDLFAQTWAPLFCCRSLLLCLNVLLEKRSISQNRCQREKWQDNLITEVGTNMDRPGTTRMCLLLFGAACFSVWTSCLICTHICDKASLFSRRKSQQRSMLLQKEVGTFLMCLACPCLCKHLWLNCPESVLFSLVVDMEDDLNISHAMWSSSLEVQTEKHAAPKRSQPILCAHCCDKIILWLCAFLL